MKRCPFIFEDTNGRRNSHDRCTGGQTVNEKCTFQSQLDNDKSMLLTCYDHIMEMPSDGNIPFLPLRYSSFSRLLVFLMRLCSEFETNAAAGSGCKRNDESEREREREEKVTGSDSFINLALNYLLHFTCVCVDDRTETTATCGKDNETARTMTTIG